MSRVVKNKKLMIKTMLMVTAKMGMIPV